MIFSWLRHGASGWRVWVTGLFALFLTFAAPTLSAQDDLESLPPEVRDEISEVRKRFLEMQRQAIEQDKSQEQEGEKEVAPPPPYLPFLPFEMAYPPKELFVIPERAMNPAEQVLMASLQGLLSRDSDTQIYILPDHPAYKIWLENLQINYGVQIRNFSNAWNIIRRFSTKYKDGILYEFRYPPSINTATSICGVMNALAVEVSIEDKANAYGIRTVRDVRRRTPQWAHEWYGKQFNRLVHVEQEPRIRVALRDYAVMTRAFTFSGYKGRDRLELLGGLESDALLLGWGEGDEWDFIENSTRAGVFTVPADYARNLAPLSGVRLDAMRQRTPNQVIHESDVHYVCFVFTDGDNLQWFMGDFATDERWFGSPRRGKVPIGWGAPPSTAALCPSILQWYYLRAEEKGGRDYFVSGPSGNGYFFPSRYPPEALKFHANGLGESLRRAGLNIVQIIDKGALDKKTVWDHYTTLPGIRALFYAEYSRYDAEQGRIVWSNGKPVIAFRDMLWDGIDGCDEVSLINRLNAAPAIPSDPVGYTLVAVHAWSKTVDDVIRVTEGLSDRVRVVPPDEFVTQMEFHLKDRRR